MAVILLCMALGAYAQQFNFTFFDQTTGLPHNDIYDILEDEAGLVWLASPIGISSFDGTRFVAVQLPDSFDSAIQSFCQDDNNNIWFCDASSHVGYFDPRDLSKVTYVNGGRNLEQASSNRSKIYVEPDSSIWVLTGAHTYRSSNLGESFERIHEVDSKEKQQTLSMLRTKSGALVFGAWNKITIFNDGEFYQHSNLFDEPRYNGVTALWETEDGSLLLGTNGFGIFKIPEVSELHKACNDEHDWLRLLPADNLAARATMSIFENQAGTIWASTANGIYRLPHGQTDWHHVSPNSGIPFNFVLKFFEDSKRNFWLGGYEGGIAILPNYASDIWAHRVDPEQKSAQSNLVRDIVFAPDSKIYAATANGLFECNHRSNNGAKEWQLVSDLSSYGALGNLLSTAWYDQYNRIWVGSKGAGAFIIEGRSIRHLNKENGLINMSVEGIELAQSGDVLLLTNEGVSAVSMTLDRIKNHPTKAGIVTLDIKQAQNGTIYVATSAGLGILDADSIKILPVTQKLPVRYITCLAESNDGQMWFGIEGAGIYRLEADGSLLAIGEKDGLTSNQIRWMQFDAKNRLWVGHAAGIDRVELNPLQVEHFPSLMYGNLSSNKRAATLGPDGNLWFGTTGGIVQFPVNDSTIKLSLPTVRLESVQQANGVLVETDAELKHNENNLRFYVNTIAFTAPELVRVQWKLTGLDEEWSEPSTIRSIPYPNLPPGDYTFQVRGTKDGISWTDPESYSFSILKPIWQRTWFIATAIIVGLVAILLFNRALVAFRTRSLVRAREFLERSLQERNEELERTNEELAKLSIVAQNTSNAVIIADAGGRIEWVNQAFAKMTGYKLTEVVGTFGEAIRVDEKAIELEGNIFRRVIENKRPAQMVLRNKARHGIEFWTYTSMTPVFDENDKVRRIIALETDITERIESEKALTEAKERAEESERIKEQFLANMSHEIRTPMNAIVGMVELLSKSEQAPQESKYIRTIRSAIRNLLVIIDDILDFSKIEAGKILFEKAGFRLTELVEEVADLQRSKAAQKGIELNTQIDSSIPEYVVGDPVRLGQILHNLVSNAIKFTEKGSVTVAVNSGNRSEASLELHFSVTDTGIGISEDKQALIFESFTQERADTTRKYGGTGLGLAIALQLVELQGGQMKLHSQLGEGSSFQFNLSFGLDTAGIELWDAAPEANSEGQLEGLKVLVVDDNELNHHVAESLLKDLIPTVEIDTAWNGTEAIKKVTNNNYDVVLMDVQMPDIDGYETTRIIRSEVEGKMGQVPVLAMTANAMAGEAERCKAAGMDGYIPKPIEGKRLFKSLVGLLTNFQSPEEAQTKKFTDLSGQVVDLTGMMQSARGNHKRAKRYIGIVLKNTPPDLQALKEARSASDWEGLAAKAHDMKGNMGYIGANEVAQHLEDLRTVVLDGKDAQQIDALIAGIERDCTTAMIELQAMLKQLE